MAIAVVATTSKSGPGTSPSIDTTGANLIVITTSEYSGGGAGLTDSKGNTWSALTTRSSGPGGNSKQRIRYCVAPTVGSGHTFTFTGGALESFEVVAVSGAAASPYDTENGNGNSTQPGSITPSEGGCLVVCGLSADVTVSAPTIGSGFTLIASRGFVSGLSLQSGGGYIIQTSAAAVNPAWSDTGACGIASFKSAAAASSIKTINGLARASVKTINGLAIASVKKFLGLA